MTTLPAAESSIQAKAHFWLEHGEQLTKDLYAIKDEITAHMRERGDLPGLGLQYRYEYPVDAGAEFPHLVSKHLLEVEVQEAGDFGRLLDLVLEQMPEAKTRVNVRMDGRRVNQVLLRGGADAARLQQLRIGKARLVRK